MTRINLIFTKYLFLLGISISLTSACKGQQDIKFDYQALPDKYKTSVDLDKFVQESEKLKVNGYDITQLLPTGFVKDGSVDYTSYLQSALNKNRIVVFPAFPILVNKQGLTLNDNNVLVFPNGASLIMSPNANTKYEILRMHNVQNVTIYFPNIIGDRKKHTGQQGEWGMGIAIRSSKNIKIINPKVVDCWGDGIYIGQINNVPSTNIEIYDPILDYNRRNGISITCVNGLNIVRPVVSNTYGTLPMSGIDIEPNSNKDIVDNISIDKPITYNNAQFGIVIGLSKLPGNIQRTVNITITDHVDEVSNTGFFMGGFRRNYDGNNVLKGNIKILNPSWKNNKLPFRGGKTYDYAPQIEMRNISVIKAEKNENDEVQRIKKEFGIKKNLKIQ